MGTCSTWANSSDKIHVLLMSENHFYQNARVSRIAANKVQP